MNCKYCKTIGIPEGEVFCPECGKPLEWPARTEDRETSGTGSKTQNASAAVTKDNILAKAAGDSTILSVVGYITWIGFIVALVIRDKEDKFVLFHLNQSLVINVFSLISIIFMLIPIVGTITAAILNVLLIAAHITGIIYAATKQMKEIPVIGKIHWLDQIIS